MQGVGAKVALGILGALPGDALLAAIARQDKAMMARAPGVGPKLAARLVLELKDKAPALGGGDLGRARGGAARAGLPKAADDAVLALSASATPARRRRPRSPRSRRTWAGGGDCGADPRRPEGTGAVSERIKRTVAAYLPSPRSRGRRVGDEHL